MHFQTVSSRPKTIQHLRLLLVAALFLPIAAAAETPPEEEPIPAYTTIHAGHSAMWYDPARSGEGWMLEVLPDDGAVVYWFTFDEEGQPRWLTGGGNIVRGENGDEIRFDSLIAVHGPQFGPDFDPADAVREDKGSAILRFHDCDSGDIHFDAYGQQGSFELTRLTRTMGTSGCRPIHGTPGEPVQPYAGQSGSWYDPAYSGQGYSLGWMANGDAALVWFTFDSEGQPYWLTAIGKAEGEQIIFPKLFAVHGGRFADDFDPADVVRTSWGRLEMTLDCDVGQAVYQPTEAGFAAGEFDLQRLTRLQDPACPWVKPKLTDLYEITLTDLPVPVPMDPPPGASSGNLIAVHGVADEGTVVGTRKLNQGSLIFYRPVRLRPGETDWQDVHATSVTGTVFVSAQGDEMLFNQLAGGPIFVRDGESASMLGLISAWRNNVWAVSDDLSFAAGEALVPVGPEGLMPKLWIWSKDHGAVLLPTSDDLPTPTAMCISNDGKTVNGMSSHLDSPLFPAWALRWLGTGLPKYIYDAMGVPFARLSACSSDGQTVYGTLPMEPGENGEWIYGMPGFIGKAGISGHLGPIHATEDNPFGWQHVANHVSSEGTLAGGAYRSPGMVGSLPNGGSAWGALIWTQDTGHVLLPELLEELGQAMDWPSMWVTGVSPSGEYLVVTTGEIFQRAEVGAPSFMHSVLVRLVKK